MSDGVPEGAVIHDVLIIGGGPSGLFAAYYAGLRDLKSKIIDSLPELGGQLSTIYPEKPITDIPGFKEIVARQYADALIAQAMQAHPSVALNERVSGMRRIVSQGENIICLETIPGGNHYGRSMLLTAGLGDIAPKTLSLPEIAKFENNGISYFVKERESLRGKRVLIVGGGDSAVDWSVALDGIAKEVTLIHRRKEFRAHEEGVRMLLATGTRIKTPYELSAVVGDSGVAGATITNNETGAIESLVVDHILFSLGFQSTPGPLKQWGIELEKNDIKVSTEMASNVPGIYAAGDVSWYPGKLKLIVTGLGEAAIAVNAIKNYISTSRQP